MTEPTLVHPGHRVAALLAGLFLLVANAAIYASRPRLVAWFRRQVGCFPNIAEPTTFNEKITWRKVFDRNPLFPILQDKLAARDYVAARCPDLALPEILWQGHDPFAIPFDRIRDPVVIKTNHGCGYNYFVPDPKEVDRLAVSVFFARALGQRWAADAGEWAYQAIKPTLYVEKLLLRKDGTLEHDCKINVFCGKVHVYALTCGRLGDLNTAYFDARDRRVEASLDGHDVTNAPVPGPLNERAIAYAEALCPDLDAIRVDCYVHQDQVWFGEFTLYPNSGMSNYQPPSFNIERARPWNILKSHYFGQPGRFRRFYRWCLESRARCRK